MSSPPKTPQKTTKKQKNTKKTKNILKNSKIANYDATVSTQHP